MRALLHFASPNFGHFCLLRSGGDIFYTDANACYMFVGKVVDLSTLQDLTRAHADELAAIHFADLPLALAIKNVKGSGQRVMAVFEDPNCPYCRKLHETLPGAPSACPAPNDQVLALGRKLHVQGTPTIYFAEEAKLRSAHQ